MTLHEGRTRVCWSVFPAEHLIISRWRIVGLSDSQQTALDLFGFRRCFWFASFWGFSAGLVCWETATVSWVTWWVPNHCGIRLHNSWSNHLQIHPSPSCENLFGSKRLREVGSGNPCFSTSSQCRLVKKCLLWRSCRSIRSCHQTCRLVLFVGPASHSSDLYYCCNLPHISVYIMLNLICRPYKKKYKNRL